MTAIVGGGAGLLRQLGGPGAVLDTGAANNDAATSAESGESGQVLRAPSAVRPVASGTDYDADTLSRAAALADQRAAASGSSPGGQGLGPDTEAQPGTPPAGLARLTDPAALSACLRAVSTVHGVAPVIVQVVDLAAYRGEPAVVVVFTDGAARWTWVSGPGCGLPTMGADTRYSGRVG